MLGLFPKRTERIGERTGARLSEHPKEFYLPCTSPGKGASGTCIHSLSPEEQLCSPVVLIEKLRLRVGHATSLNDL